MLINTNVLFLYNIQILYSVVYVFKLDYNFNRVDVLSMKVNVGTIKSARMLNVNFWSARKQM